MIYQLVPSVMLRRKLKLLDRLEGELKQTGVEKERLAKEKDELTRESKRLQHAVQNPKFDISKFKERDEDVEFYTGLPHWDALMLLYGMLHDKAQNLNYGTYENLLSKNLLRTF